MPSSLPTYQNLFGTSDYYTVPADRSVLSPAAYLVELLKLVENNINIKGQGQNLQTRRPDIYSMFLDSINTENEFPKLEIVNGTLKNNIGTINPEIATYPFNLPYNESLERVRHYVAQNKMTLAEIWKTFNKGYQGQPHVAMSIFLETLGLSAEQWQQFSAHLEANTLYQYYGFPHNTQDSTIVAALSDVQTFLSQTGMTQDLLYELVYEDLSQSEIGDSQANYQGKFYINLKNSNTPILISGKNLYNLTSVNLARIMRFVRMAKAIGWSLTDFNWALQTIRPLVNSRNEALPYLAWIQEQVKQKGLTVTECCGFLGQIKSFGKKNGACFYDIIFKNPENPQLPPVPTGKSYLTWNVPQAGSPSLPADKQIENALSAALQLSQQDLLTVTEVIIQHANGKSSQFLLDEINIALLYRMSLLSGILDESINDVLVASAIITQGEDIDIEAQLISTQDLYASTLYALSHIEKLFVWLSTTPLSLGQLEFITLGKSCDTNIQNSIVSSNAVRNFISTLQSSLKAELVSNNNLYTVLYNDVTSFYKTLISSDSFSKLITLLGGQQTVKEIIDYLSAHTDEFCKYIIVGNGNLDNSDISIYDQLQNKNLLSKTGIINSVCASNEAFDKQINSIIVQAVICTLNSLKLFSSLTIDGLWTYNGTAWSRVKAFDNYEVTSIAYNGTLSYAGTTANGLWVFNSAEWTQVSELANFEITSIVCTGTIVYTGTASNGLWVFNSAEWIQVSELVNYGITSIVCSGTTIYAGTAVNGLWAFDGKKWSQVSELANYEITSILCCGTIVYAGTTANGLWVFDEEGWSQVSDLANYNIASVVWGGATLYAGTAANGLWVFDEEEWLQVSDLANYTITSIVWDGTILYVGTVANGLWAYNGSEWSQIAISSISDYCTKSLANINGIIYVTGSLLSSFVLDQLKQLSEKTAAYLSSTYTNQQQILSHNFASFYQTTTAIAQILRQWGDLNLSEIFNSNSLPKDPPLNLLQALLPQQYLKANNPVDPIIGTLEKLQQAAILITNFSLSSAEASFFKTTFTATSGFPITLHAVKQIWKFKQLVKAFKDSQNNLLNIIKAPDAGNWQSSLEKISGWKEGDIDTMIDTTCLNIDKPSLHNIYLLYKYFTTATTLGIKVHSLWELAQLASKFQTITTITLVITQNIFTSIALNGENEESITTSNVNQYVTIATGDTSFNPLMNELASLQSLVGSQLIIQNPFGVGNLASGIIADVFEQYTTSGTVSYTLSLNPIYPLASDLWAGLRAQLKDSPGQLNKIQNRLDEKLRNKLVPLVCYALGSQVTNPLSYYGATARGLYAYLLIDVEVSGAVQTTYIREAISAVQLYIYRCLNQLEPDVIVSSDLQPLWQWMQNYREWQANMEVFLYPENYIEPELRLEKTDLYSKAEHALKQADLTNPETVETIFLDYMNGFEEIGNLQVISCASHDCTATDVEGSENFKELCMIAVGPAGHGQYYYRLSRFNTSGLQTQYVPYDWGQWKKIAVTMNTVEYQAGQYGTPKSMFVFGRWYIFWVEQKQSGGTTDSGGANSNTYTATVKFTYLDFNKNWTAASTLLSNNLLTSINNKQESEIQWSFQPVSQDDLIFYAFNNMYSYQPSKAVPLTSCIKCLQFLDTETNAGTCYGIISVTGTSGWNIQLANVNVLCFGPSRSPYYAGTSAGLYQYGSGSWSQVSGFPNIAVQCICYDTKGNWLVGTSSGLYYSTDGGQTWQVASNGIPSTANVQCVESDATWWIAGTSSGVYGTSSFPLGDWQWRIVGKPNIPSNANAQYLAVNNNIWLVGTSCGLYFASSAPNLGSWAPVSGIPANINVQCVMTDGKWWMAGTSAGLYYSNVAPGNSWAWEPVTAASQNGIPFNANVQCLAYNNEGNWLAGTSLGLYCGVEGGASWGLLTGLPATANIENVIFAGNQFWYASTSNCGGLYAADSTDLSTWTPIQIPYNPIQPIINPSTVYGIATSIPIQGEPDWFIVNGNRDQYLNISYPPGDSPTIFNVYRLNSTAIPQLGAFLNEDDGINQLLTINAQQTKESLFDSLDPVSTYIPSDNYPLGQIDFSDKSAMCIYYWELFFHIPFLIANELNKQQDFANAKLWYEYIFNPIIKILTEPINNKYWQFLGLRTDGNNPNITLANELAEGEIAELRNDLHNFIQLYTSESDPFDPQAIAQLRPIAYQKTIVMHYVNNLLSWGDMLYRENTRESINEAEMLYVLAYNLLGEQPQSLGPEPLAEVCNYDSIDNFRSIWDANTAVNSICEYNGLLYAGTDNGLYQSPDGINWSEITNPEVNGKKIYFLLSGSDCLYVTGDTNSTAIYSFNGSVWSSIQLPSASKITSIINIGTAIFATWNGSGSGFLLESADTMKQFCFGCGFECLTTYNDLIAFGTAGNQTWLTSVTSANAGSLDKQTSSTGDQVSCLCEYNNNLYQGTPSNIYYYSAAIINDWSENSQWIATTNAPTNTNVLCVFDGNLYAGTNNGLYVLDSSTETWNQVNITISNINCIFGFNGILYLGTQDGVTAHFPYFGIPRNEQFLSYWSEVKQRIYNIRHGLTITGQTDNLPLFSPPINPMDLVEAIGSGESVAEAMQSVNYIVPYYRFEIMIQKAKEMTVTVIQFGQSLLSALQTKDTQKLAELYNKNERHLLALTQNSKQDSLSNAQQNVLSLQQALVSAQNRFAYYSGLINAGLSSFEQSQVNLAGQAITAQGVVEGIRVAAIVGYSMPTIFGFSDGGFHPGEAINQGATIAEGVGNIFNQQSGLAGINAGYQRRLQDWQLQSQLAQDDISQVNCQIVAAQYQQDLAQQEINLLNKQLEQQHKVAEFYKSKFTNNQLYGWYIGQLSGLYFQAYQLAHDLAMQAENAWEFEHVGLPFSNQKDNFIKSGYWNSLYEGLLAGESLELDLQRMEKSYMDQNVRRFEITKTVSLALLDPDALTNLINTGTCQFDLIENDFAWDYPGHYCRKIKSISISIPMVVGPYQNIHATLTQTSNKLINSDEGDGQNAVQYLLNPNKNPLSQNNTALQVNLVPNQQIALSQGVNDTGMFELNFNDPRYLPFEGTGATSSWQLDLPMIENAISYCSITDVIIQLNYTALPASHAYKKAVIDTRNNQLGRYIKIIKNPSDGTTFDITPGQWAGVSQPTVQIDSVTMVILSGQKVSNTTVTISETETAVRDISFSQWKCNQSVGSINNFNIPATKQTPTLKVTGTLPSDTKDILLIIKYLVTG